MSTLTSAITASSTFEKLFVSYGAGSNIFLPVLRSKFWNTASWVIIAVATVAWTVDLVVYYFLLNA